MKKIIGFISVLTALSFLTSCGNGDNVNHESTSSDIDVSYAASPSDINDSPSVPDSGAEPDRSLRDNTTALSYSAGGSDDSFEAKLVYGEFENGPFFSLYVDENYSESVTDGKYRYSEKEPDSGSHIEIGFIKDAKADDIAGAFLESYDKITSLEDHGNEDLGGVFTVRRLSAQGELFNWEAQLIEGGVGVLTIVFAYSPQNTNNDAERLGAMAQTVLPE